MTGLPARVTSARTRPSPGVSISSARQTAGSSPKTSPRPRTRLANRPRASSPACRTPGCRCRSGRRPRRRARPRARGPCGGSRAPGSRRRPRRCPAERLGQLADLVDAVAEGRQLLAGVGQVLLAQHVDEREEQQRVGAGADEVVLVRFLGGPRPARVDHHELATAGPQGTQPAAHVRGGHEAAVGRERVGAEDEQVLGAVHVGHWDRGAGAEHERAGQLLGHLVHAGGRVDVAGRQRLEQHAAVEQAFQVVGVGVAQVDGHRVAVRGQDRGQPVIDEGERLVPARGAMAVAVPDHRRAQAVRVLVQLLERRALGAHEAAAEDVLRVAPDRDELVAVERQLQAARGLAQRAGPERRPVAINRHVGERLRGMDRVRDDL
jgi:hypothetical protein